MRNKKAQIELILFVVIICLLLVLYVVLSINFQKFKESREGRCFIKQAKSFCKGENMEFKKLYIWLYGDYEFACKFRDNTYNYDFTREEKLKCGDYYGE